MVQDDSRGRVGDALGRFGSGTKVLRLSAIVGWTIGVTAAVTAAAMVAGALGGWVVLTGPSSWDALQASGFGLGATALAGAGALLILVPLGLRLPGIVHLIYLGLVISIPMVGLALGIRATTEVTSPAVHVALAAGLLIPAGVGWYATHVEPYRLVIEQATVSLPTNRTGTDPIRIGVLADLQTDHVGDHEHRAIDRLLAENPDLILVPGDLFQGSDLRFESHEAPIRSLLGRLHAPAGVYFVRGDTDPGNGADRALRDTGIVILDDEIVELSIGDRRLRLGGTRLAYASPSATRLRRDLEASPDDNVICLLVSHRPDTILDLTPHSRVDLSVAGHTHGGQVVVPGFGQLVTYSRVPRSVGAGGLHQLNGNRIYVSTGVGLERVQAPQIRLFCRPSIGIITLR